MLRDEFGEKYHEERPELIEGVWDLPPYTEETGDGGRDGDCWRLGFGVSPCGVTSRMNMPRI